MNALIQHPRAIPPMPAVARILSRFDRQQLEGFIAVAIDLADALDGDPDIEPNGDELDGSMGEDDFCSHAADSHGHPGCPIADPDSAVDDRGCDDINDDREPDDSPYTCSYAIDQSNVLPSPSGRDVVVDYDCSDAVRGPSRTGRRPSR